MKAVNVKFDEAEWKIASDAAHDHRITLSEFIRRAVKEKATKTLSPLAGQAKGEG